MQMHIDKELIKFITLTVIYWLIVLRMYSVQLYYRKLVEMLLYKYLIDAF